MKSAFPIKGTEAEETISSKFISLFWNNLRNIMTNKQVRTKFRLIHLNFRYQAE